MITRTHNSDSSNKQDEYHLNYFYISSYRNIVSIHLKVCGEIIIHIIHFILIIYYYSSYYTNLTFVIKYVSLIS